MSSWGHLPREAGHRTPLGSCPGPGLSGGQGTELRCLGHRGSEALGGRRLRVRGLWKTTHLDCRAAGPRGRSGHWRISGTGPPCAVLQGESPSVSQPHSSGTPCPCTTSGGRQGALCRPVHSPTTIYHPTSTDSSQFKRFHILPDSHQDGRQRGKRPASQSDRPSALPKRERSATGTAACPR